jgi:hypothetical protein
MVAELPDNRLHSGSQERLWFLALFLSAVRHMELGEILLFGIRSDVPDMTKTRRLECHRIS